MQKAKGERGVPLTVNVPFGYLKDPEDKTKWIVDEAAAVVVKRIFKLCMEGRGPMQIAKLLREEKVLNPTAYKRRAGIKTPSPETDDPYLRCLSKAISNTHAHDHHPGQQAPFEPRLFCRCHVLITSISFFPHKGENILVRIH